MLSLTFRLILVVCPEDALFRLIFFFQAEDGIRDWSVTGVQTCALPIFNASIDQLPSVSQEGSYDGVTMFVVLEHIPDDAYALQFVNRKLKPGGRVALSVPAYMWLWGQQDIVNQHCRRYTMTEVRRKLQTAHFTLERMTYFNTFLFLPIAVVRLISRFSRQAYEAEGDFAHVRRPSNALLFTLFGAERFALRYLHFPFGVSIFAVARKEYIE